MALTRVTLTAPISAAQTLIAVSSTATGFPVLGTVGANQPMAIDDEICFITGVPSAGLVVVRGRGSDGTVATPHDVLSAVITSGVPGDFPAPAPGASTIRPRLLPDIITYGQDGEIGQPLLARTMAYLAKATAGAFTLAAPSLALNGITLVITSQTAATHVVTATALFNTGVSVSPFSVATFGSVIGTGFTVVAQNGLWNVTSTNGTVTFT